MDAETRKGIEAAVTDLQSAMEGDDGDAIKQKTETLAQLSMKLGEQLYAQQAEAGEAEAGGEAGGEGAQSADEDIVDADFEEVDDDDDKKKSA